MKFLYIVLAICALASLLYLALKLFGRLVLGEFPKSEAQAKSPSIQKSSRSKESTASWTHFIQMTVIAVVVGIFSVSRINGCTEMVREWKASDARTAAYEANPDNYWWELWEFSDEKWLHKGYGMSRETSATDGRVVLKWRSDGLGGNNITANCIPGKEGSWEAIDGYGNPIKRYFSITSVTNEIVQGNLEQICTDGKVHRMPFRFIRREKK